MGRKNKLILCRNCLFGQVAAVSGRLKLKVRAKAKLDGKTVKEREMA